MKEEIWKDIEGYEGYYKVSNTMCVMSCDRFITNIYGVKRFYKSQIMRPYLGRDGYIYYLLTKNKVSKHIALHRILAMTFIPNLLNKREVNHIDSNRLNNDLSNLEWVTPKENIHHAMRVGNNKQCLPGIHNPAAKLT